MAKKDMVFIANIELKLLNLYNETIRKTQTCSFKHALLLISRAYQRKDIDYT